MQDLRTIIKCLAICAALAIIAGCGDANDDSYSIGDDDTPCKTSVCAEDGCEWQYSDDWTVRGDATPPGVCLNGTLFPDCDEDDGPCTNGYDCVWVLNEKACDDTACPGRLLCAPNCDDGNDCTDDFVQGCECQHVPIAHCGGMVGSNN